MLSCLCYHWAIPKTHPTLIVAWHVPGPKDILSVRTNCSNGGGKVKYTHRHTHSPTNMYTYTCAYTQAYMWIYANMCIHTCIYLCTHLLTCTQKTH